MMEPNVCWTLRWPRAVLAEHFCRTCISAAYAVMRCLYVCPSATFVYSVKTSNHILKRFHRRVARPFWFFPNQTLWQYSDGNPLNGASNAGGVGKNRNSLPISGFIACCQRSDRQVLYTQLHRIVASWWHSSPLSGVVCSSRETDDEVFMTRSANVTPMTTEHNLIVRIGKTETAIPLYL